MIGIIRRYVKSRSLREAQKARAEALRAVAAAEARGDTRTIGKARMILQAATISELAAGRGR